MNRKRRKLGKIISLAVACLLLFPPFPAESCEEGDQMQETCCCCACCHDSEPFLPQNDAERDDCSCRITEKNDVENSPAVIFSSNDNRPQTSLLTSKVEASFEDYQSRLVSQLSKALFLPSRDQPLYILHSSFLI